MEALQGNSAALRYGLFGLAVLALFAFVPSLVRRVKEGSGGWISVSELKCRLAESGRAAVLDVREAEDFNGPLGHIPSAMNIPLNALEGELAN